jgi:dynein heavy chain
MLQDGDRMHRYASRYPGVLAGCTIDWYHRWPREALIAVADHHLHDFEPECSVEIKYQLSGNMASIFDGVVDCSESFYER